MRAIHLTLQALRADQLTLVTEDDSSDLTESDLELLSTALQEASEAREQGAVIGPEPDELTLRRAERRARRADGRRERATWVLDGAA